MLAASLAFGARVTGRQTAGRLGITARTISTWKDFHRSKQGNYPVPDEQYILWKNRWQVCRTQDLCKLHD